MGIGLSEFESDVPSVQLFSYARALDGSGFVNSLAGTAKEEQNEEGYWYYLPLVNAGSNQATRSTVRITNLGPNWASDVQLIGFDWDGVRYPRSGTTYLAPNCASEHNRELHITGPGSRQQCQAPRL